tara:strand:+ start:132610 stop:133392 length:783 start_codon:yes stop_codon:yes gene_type:complete
MKRVVFSILAVSVLLVSCNNKSENDQTTDLQTDNSANDLAIADTSNENVSDTYLYVTAVSGLSLREHNNLNSEKLGRMPYGTKIRVIASEEKPTMTVGGIKGAMDQVEYNHKTGYAFNGYLSKFFPPEKDAKPKYYAEELKTFFPKVSYSESVGGTASKPINTQTLLLPTQQWHEAFFVAQQLYDFPKELQFPNAKGKDEQIIKDSKPKKDVWTSELRVNREDNSLQKIEYHYLTKGFGYTVSITPEGEMMKLEKTEVVE